MISTSKSDKLFSFTNYLLLCIILIIVLYPLIFVVSASISDPYLVSRGEMWLLPKGITFEGYRRVFQNDEVLTGYRNTIFYTLFGTLINLFMTLTCAYPLSRKDFIGRNFFMAIFTFTMFFSGGLIPSYIIIKKLGMLNKIWALIIPNAVSMMNVIIVRTFFQSNIPSQLQEAAEIDGCSIVRLFTNIILPLSKPIIAVMALFYGVQHWNSFFAALIYLTDRSLFPLQLILREILIQNQMSSQMLMTGNELDLIAKQAKAAELIKYSIMIVSTLPVLVAYPFLQRFFVHGIMVGAIKG
ncbi:MAG: carbohydrate ABC transporter permease [Firmicutes bacterium]|nr:carbohydrate ABC transporter permease [Bacillota bacterium]